MAESVQFHLEKMLPELEDLEKRGIFSKTEIKQIVKKRTELEYAVHKRVSKKSDFLRYVEYEMNLDRLRRKRKARLGLDKRPSAGQKGMNLSDHSLVQRIHGIYSKALKRFSGDVSLWIQYFEWCKAVKSSKALGSNYARAIQLHPTKPVLWIQAAAWEFEDNGNVNSARVLLQRGIRVNPESQQLWLEYFKLELLWVEKIKERRKVLFGEKLLNGSTDNNAQEDTITAEEEKDEDAVGLPELDIEKKAKESSSSTAFELGSMGTKNQLSVTRTALLELVIPRTVYRNAIRSIPNDIDFRLKFLDVYLQFTGSEIGINEVYNSISADFKTPQAIAIIAGRSVKKVAQSDPEFPMALKAAVTLFEEHLVALMSPEFCELYANFLASLLVDCTEPHLIKYLTIILERLYEKAEGLNLMTDTMYAQWADRVPGESGSIIFKGLQVYHSSQLLWLKKLSTDATLTDYQQALSSVKGESSFPIWTLYLDLLISQCNNNTRQNACSDYEEDSDMEDAITEGIFIEDVTKAFVLALSPVYLDATAFEFQMSESFLEWILSVSGIEGVRKAGQDLISLKPRHAPFYSAWNKLEMAQPAFDKARISKLYEASIASDPMNMNTWLAYSEFLLKHCTDAMAASQVCWRANKHLTDKDTFMAKYESLKLSV